jgi:hypothetical protein
MIINYIILGLVISFSSQTENWTTYYENDNFEVFYRSQRCNDVKNGFDFSFYLIKVTNKTQNTIVVDFVLGNPVSPSQREEDKIILILKENESKQGTCYGYENLRLYISYNITQKKIATKKFELSNINFVKIK